MKKIILLFALISTTFIGFSQETKDEEAPKEGWTRGGNISLLFNQSAFSDWVAGGQNNISGTLGINYDFNYKKEGLTWDNKIIVAYGLSKNKGEDQRKTDDRLEFNSLIGKKAKGFWYYSWFFNAKTQMDVGYDADTGIETSHGFSPTYLQTGPGMLWKKSDNLKVNISPATARLIIVHDHFTEFGESFGVEQGKTTRFEFGAALGAYYKLAIMKNITMENILNLYTNYLENPQNVDLDYTMNLVMTVNKYISANFTFQTIYDDNAFQGFQVREVFGIGFNYGF
ncbi:MAG: DUF3078 domain-containing protein [Flavobacteriales bacterium]